jgi:hypothetical protein
MIDNTVSLDHVDLFTLVAIKEKSEIKRPPHSKVITV